MTQPVPHARTHERIMEQVVEVPVPQIEESAEKIQPVPQDVEVTEVMEIPPIRGFHHTVACKARQEEWQDRREAEEKQTLRKEPSEPTQESATIPEGQVHPPTETVGGGDPVRRLLCKTRPEHERPELNDDSEPVEKQILTS